MCYCTQSGHVHCTRRFTSCNAKINSMYFAWSLNSKHTCCNIFWENVIFTIPFTTTLSPGSGWWSDEDTHGGSLEQIYWRHNFAATYFVPVLSQLDRLILRYFARESSVPGLPSPENTAVNGFRAAGLISCLCNMYQSAKYCSFNNTMISPNTNLLLIRYVVLLYHSICPIMAIWCVIMYFVHVHVLNTTHLRAA